MKSYRQQQGNSLIELAVVLVVLGLLAFMTISSRQSSLSSIDYSSVKSAADVIGVGMQNYYSRHCTEGTAMATPTVAGLVADGNVPSAASVENRLGLPYVLNITGLGTRNVSLLVSVTMASDAIATRLNDEAVYASRAGSVLTYLYKPQMATDAQSMRSMQMREFFGGSVCM